MFNNFLISNSYISERMSRLSGLVLSTITVMRRSEMVQIYKAAA